jgi:hypothetical protein
MAGDHGKSQSRAEKTATPTHCINPRQAISNAFFRDPSCLGISAPPFFKPPLWKNPIDYPLLLPRFLALLSGAGFSAVTLFAKIPCIFSGIRKAHSAAGTPAPF